MSAYFQSIEGTEMGHMVALALAIWAAAIHAIFGALQKGRTLDPWISRGAIDISYGALAFPFLFIVPFPEPFMWPLFAGMIVVHFAYKYLQAKTYERGAFTVVYPVVRGLGPFFAVCGAYVIFAERFTFLQWLGVAVLLCGIFGLSFYNARKLDVGRETLRSALFFAALTGISVAIYTTVDAYGIRATADPFTFLAWFFFLDGLNFTPLAAWRYAKMQKKPPLRALALTGITGGLLAPLSFGAIMLATRLDKVGEAAVLRETSIVWAALIGWFFLGEKVGPWRLTLMALIAMGAVLVEFGG